jgi:FG-GAP-like repeat/FG-GAP repeat
MCSTTEQVGDDARAQADAACGSSRFPHFDRALLLENTSETSANVSIGDLNGDGHLDIVLAKGRHWPLVSRIFLNDGHGRFPVAHDLGGTPYRSYSAVLVDVDGDGFLDLVVGNDAPDPKVVYLNDGKGNFSLGSTFGRPEWPTRNVAVADLNGDGLPDIIVANRYGNRRGSNYVCLNRGRGKYDADCIAFSQESATTITPADFNGDGFVDLAVPNRDGGQSYVYLNDGRANFSKRIPFGSPSATIRVAAAAGLTGSGRMDIVTIDERRGTFIHFNQPDGTFSPAVPLGTVKATPYALAVGDLNRDGEVDIVVGYVNAPSVVYFNHGEGRSFTPVPFGDDKGTVYGFAFGDLDRDGWPDIAVARSDAPNVVYFSSGAPQCTK